ncbi:MAG: DUF308 domain-containing protein [Alphaproteobacteria bacterium]|nr:DUF308 domain-containing protein [Alphaproteobacteria bacterium]
MTTQAPDGAGTGRASIFALVEGLLLAALGVGALASPVLAGFATTILFGWLLMGAGLAGLIGVFGRAGEAHRGWGLVSSVLSLVTGGLIAFVPVAGVQVLVLVIGAWLIFDGVSSFMIARHLRGAGRSGSGWLAASAFVDVILAVGLAFLGPLGGLIAVGVIIGVDLIFGGLALAAIGWALRKAA